MWFLTVTCSCCPYLYYGSAIMFVIYLLNFRQLNDHLFGKELFIRFNASAFRKLLSIYVFSYFHFGFDCRIRDLIVSVPDHCLSFYFSESTCLAGRAKLAISGSNGDLNCQRMMVPTAYRYRVYLNLLRKMYASIKLGFLRFLNAARSYAMRCLFSILYMT